MRNSRRAATVAALVTFVLFVLRMAPARIFNAGVVAVVVLATYELYRLPAVSTHNRVYRASGLVGAAVVAGGMVVLPPAALVISIPLITIVLLSILILTTRRPNREEFHELLFVVFGVLYVPSTLGQLILIRNLRLGRDLATAFVVTVLAREVVAHVAGSIFPTRRPVNDSINPRKSFVGAAIGILAACVAVIVLSRYLSVEFTTVRAVLFGVCVGVACQFGDLAESYIKRVAGRRHSGAWLGPEGGVLDFVDAASFAAATAHPLLLWWGFVPS